MLKRIKIFHDRRDQGISSSTVFPINSELPNNTVNNPLPNPVYVRQLSGCGYVIALLIFAILLGASLGLFCTLTQLPKPEIYVNSMAISHLNVSTSVPMAFSAKWEVGFLIKNTSKKTKLHYSGIRVSICYEGAFFAETRMESFYQEKKSEMAVKVDGYVMENRFKGGNRNVEMKLAADLKKGIVNFEVGWDNWKDADGYSGYSVSCSDISVLITSSTNGTMLGESKKCKVLTPCMQMLDSCLNSIRPIN